MYIVGSRCPDFSVVVMARDKARLYAETTVAERGVLIVASRFVSPAWPRTAGSVVVPVFRVCTRSKVVGGTGGTTPESSADSGDVVVVAVVVAVVVVIGHSGIVVPSGGGVVQPLFGVLLPGVAKEERFGLFVMEKYPSRFGRECRELLLKLVAERCLYGDNGDGPVVVINSTEEVSEE
jgi:hypothetical protein